MSHIAKFILNNGNVYPLIGFGTYTITGAETVKRVLDNALKCGYRAFDTSSMYDNEEDIGFALKELLPKHHLKREDVCITTKLAPSDQGTERSKDAVEGALKKLQTTYIDMFLIHWPGVEGEPDNSPVHRIKRKESWQQMVELNKQGLLRNIGVSNYTVRHMKELLADCCGVRPALNQFEYHPKYKQPELLSFCQAEGVLAQAYCSLGGSEFPNMNLLNDPVVRGVAERTSRTSGQVLLRWAYQQGMSVIPKTTNPHRMVENLDLEFDLDDLSMKELNGLTEREKYSWQPDDIL